MTPYVSIVIPAYNEARRLPATLAGWRDFLTAQPYSWEIVVVDDGSTDATATVAAAAGARVLQLNPNQGKGAAVKAGVLAAASQFIAYADADLNVAPYHLQEALRRLEGRAVPSEPPSPNRQSGVRKLEGDVEPSARSVSPPSNLQSDLRGLAGEAGVHGFGESNLQQRLPGLEDRVDLVAGRRDLSEYVAAEGALRLLAGGLVQVTRRVLVMSAIRDTQCGFKVFRRDLGQAIFTRCRIRSFAFDIEVLFLARKRGARILEMPVTTTYRAESSFNVRKHLPIFLKDIVQIRLNDLAGRYDA